MKQFLARLLSALLILTAATLRAADTSLLATLTNPVSAVFNNTYRGLVEDNEKIAAADPHNSDKYLFALIASATGTLDVCVYDIGEPRVASALLDVRSRGVRLRVVTETDNTFDKEHPGVPRDTIEQLRAAKIPLVTDERGGLMHDKFMIADHANVWFGSMNCTHNGLYRDNNNSIFVRSREVAAVLEDEFESFFTRHEFGPADRTAPDSAAPKKAPLRSNVVRVGDAELTFNFSPAGGAQAAILAALERATNSIRFMVFAFTDRPIGTLLAKKKHAGLSVEGVFDECQIDRYSEFRWLGKQGVKVWTDGNQALCHHKVMIIDDETVCCGSYNFTKSAENNNNEVSVIIRSRRIAAAFRAEFDRLVFAAEHNPPLPPYDHPACRHADASQKPVPKK